MTRRMIGLIAVVGSALGAWWWASQSRTRVSRIQNGRRPDQGTVIFHNTPTASDIDAII